MNDVRIIMVDGISQSNMNSVINAFIQRFTNEYDCDAMDLYMLKDQLISDLKEYITHMDFKNSEYFNKLLAIFDNFIVNKKARLYKKDNGYIITSNYSPFNISVIPLFFIIKEELSKFHGNITTVNKIMDTLFKYISTSELQHGIPSVHRIVPLNCFTETIHIPIERGETDRIVKYSIQLEKIYPTYTLTNTLLNNKILHLRCPEYVKTKIDVKRFITEISLEKNINILFY